MIKHIVMWNIKENVEGRTKLENGKIIKEKMEELKDLIEEIVTLEVGINIVEGKGARDLVLNAEFNNLEDLDIYQKHPDHVKLVEFVGPYLENRAVIDYEI